MVSTPSAGSNFDSITELDQFVAVSEIVWQKLCVAT
jgi:hypothetical protein